MSPTAPPAVDDLLFLLSIANDPSSVIAGNRTNEKNISQPSRHDRKAVPSDTSSASSSWQQTLASLPLQRRNLTLALQRLANACQKLDRPPSSSSMVVEEGRETNIGRASASVGPLQNFCRDEAGALEEIEEAAHAIRTRIKEYRGSMEGYLGALRLFWLDTTTSTTTTLNHSCDHNCTDLAVIGSQLTSQLINQLLWEERLITHAILAFLDEDLYADSHASEDENRPVDNASTERLRVWSDSMLHMIKIDKSLWEFVEREVYDDMQLFNQQEEPPLFFNGEASTQIVPVVQPSAEPQEDDMTGGQCSETAFLGVDSNSSLHEDIASSASVEKAIETFVRADHHDRSHTRRSMTSILLVGEEGSGKTHLLDSIQQRYTLTDATAQTTSSVKVLRPKFVDLVGNTLGSSEDRLVALFTYALRFIATGSRNKCLILLDDIDRMLSLSDDTNGSESPNSDQHYAGKRCKALFLTILDNWPAAKGHLLLLCTSRSSRCSEAVGRFDRTYWRGLPDEEHRRQLIMSCLSAGNASEEGDTADNADAAVGETISMCVHHSSGRSTSELSQCCREVLLSCAKSANSDKKNSSTHLMHRLHCLDKMLQKKAPQSLRGGLLDGVVDMRVFTPEELQSRLEIDAKGTVKIPLLGVEDAYEALMNTVITPLCRSDEIRNLLYGGAPETSGAGDRIIDAKPIRVGALLTGISGVGKTSLAYHCASLAAKMSRVSLLDVSCTSLVHKEIGGSERAVQRLFATVRAASPCVLLLDGIENVAGRRGNDNTTEGTMDRILSTFLTEMDGIDSVSSNCRVPGDVAVIGVTHNPDLIDPSLLRPGRLEKIITLSSPDFEVRREIVTGFLKNVDMDFDSAGYFDAKNKEDISNFVAMRSAGLSATGVVALCREASMECLRELNYEITEKPMLTYNHFKRALSKSN